MAALPAMTAVEKIVSNHVGHPVKAGDMVVSSIDLVMAQDGNAPLAIQILREELGATETFDKDKVVLVIDHCGPSPNDGASNLQKMMRTFASECGARIFDIGKGISHVVLPESGLARPGQIVVGSDSHSTAYGAVNCFGTGMGSTDIAVSMYTGATWLRVPETIRIDLVGELPSRATAKDLALELVRTVGVAGATYACLEIGGPGLAQLNMDNRLTICSMAIEMGAKTALMPVDEVAQAYLDERPLQGGEPVWSDDACSYIKRFEIDLSQIGPLVVLPHDLTRIVDAADQAGVRVDQAFVGTCTNSRLSDLAAVAEVLTGRQVAPSVRLIVTPGSQQVYLDAVRLGYITTIIEAGGVVTTPGCGACVGTHMGIPADAETVISTANRNFKGRMGNPHASIILASPETVARSAIAGQVATYERSTVQA